MNFKNKYKIINLLIGLMFLSLFLFFVIFVYISASTKTEIAEKTLNSFLNKNLSTEQLIYKINTQNKFLCDSMLDFNFLIKTECSLKKISLSSNIETNKENINLFEVGNVNIIFYTEILATSLNKIKDSGFNINFRANNLSIDNDFFIRGLNLSKEQITENMKKNLIVLKNNFNNLKITADLTSGKINKDKQLPLKINSNLYSKDWSIENYLNLIFKVNDPVKRINLSNDFNNSSVSEKTLVLPYEINILNSSFLLLAFDKRSVKNSFYSYYQIDFDKSIDKKEFNLNLLDFDSHDLASYNYFVERVAQLLMVASPNFQFSSEAPFIEGFKEIFNGNYGVCYKVLRNKNEPLVPYTYISELMKVYPEAGMELNKKSFNRDIIPCMSIQECQKKCKE